MLAGAGPKLWLILSSGFLSQSEASGHQNLRLSTSQGFSGSVDVTDLNQAGLKMEAPNLINLWQ